MERLHPDVVGGLQGRGAENGERLRFHAEHQDRPRFAQCSNRFRTLRHGQIKNDDITAPHGFRRKTPVTGNLMLKPFQRSDVRTSAKSRGSSLKILMSSLHLYTSYPLK